MIKRVFKILCLFGIAYMFFDAVLGFVPHTQLGDVARHYVSSGPDELGAQNLVTAVVVTYRGLDTLGEVTVLFISAITVGLMLAGSTKKEAVVIATDATAQPTAQPISEPTPASELVHTATQILLPIIALFGIYVFINGHLTPGGGFQGGAIIASGTMLLLLTMPTQRLNHFALGLTESVSGFGYVLIGILGILLAGGFLDNRVIGLGTFGSLFSAGAIPVIYVLIGLKVGSELSNILDKLRN